MFLKSLAATAVFILATIAPSFANPVIDRAMDSTVIVYDLVTATLLDGTNTVTKAKKPVCSGFVVDNGPLNTEVIITAGHCTGTEIDLDADPSASFSYAPTYVTFSDGTHANVEDSFTSKLYDVSLLLVKADRYHPAASLNTSYERGDDFFTIGMPDGDFWSYGRMFATQGDYDDQQPASGLEHTLARIAAVSLWKGNSGGPVFNSKGEVVGIIDAMASDNPTIFYMVRSQHLIDSVMEMLSSGK